MDKMKELLQQLERLPGEQDALERIYELADQLAEGGGELELPDGRWLRLSEYTETWLYQGFKVFGPRDEELGDYDLQPVEIQEAT